MPYEPSYNSVSTVTEEQQLAASYFKVDTALAIRFHCMVTHTVQNTSCTSPFHNYKHIDILHIFLSMTYVYARKHFHKDFPMSNINY